MPDKEYNMAGALYRPAYSRAGTKFGKATPATLDEYGETALSRAKTKIAALDPNGTALKFAFITDLHRCGEGISYASEGVIDDTYSIRLLSRLCDEVDIDAVFCGGDIANARSENLDYHEQCMKDVVADLDEYLPYVPIFATIGNHDKKYSSSNPLRTNEWLHGLWNDVQTDGNGVHISYIDDTNFCVDFTKHKVRIIFCNQYDAVDSNPSWTSASIHCTGNWTQGFNIEDKANWFVGVVYHGADMAGYGGTFPELKENLTAYIEGGGKGAILGVAGHLHSTKEQTYPPSLNRVHVNRAYAQTSDLSSVSEYRFSVFVVDPTVGVAHEIRVGYSNYEIPFCIYPGKTEGLLQNGGVYANDYKMNFCVYNGNRVRFDRRWNLVFNGENLTDLSKNALTGSYTNDFVTSDTANVLFSAQAGDVIKTEIIFSDDTTTGRQFCIFSPQIPSRQQSGVFNAGMVYGTVTAGKTYTKEITLSADTDFTAIGISYRGQSADAAGVHDFVLNIYKNGVKMVRSDAS